VIIPQNIQSTDKKSKICSTGLNPSNLNSTDFRILRKAKIYLIILLDVFLIVTRSPAQKVEVKTANIAGKVTDLDGTALKGTNVKIVRLNKTEQIVSGEDGQFSINTSTKEDILLIFSYVGFDSLSLKIATGVNDPKTLLVKLKRHLNVIKAVVVNAAAAVKLSGDTIEYSIAAFVSKNDLVMKDFIKRLPFGDVDQFGQTTIQGLPLLKVQLRAPLITRQGKFILSNT